MREPVKAAAPASAVKRHTVAVVSISTTHLAKAFGQGEEATYHYVESILKGAGYGIITIPARKEAKA